MKIGRNEPCWCNSGKKFKHCHYRREVLPPITTQEVINELVKNHKKHLCYHPNAPLGCQGDIIKAHTIQRNGGLSKIAENGHVYTLYSILPNPNDKVQLSKVGIKQASTFTGFCKYHDNLLFAPVEDKSLQISRDSALLLAFRAICKELYAKERAMEAMPFGKSSDKGRTIAEQFDIQEHWAYYEYGTSEGLKDIQYHKKNIDIALTSGDYSQVWYYAIELDCTPDILCSGVFHPEYDFSGNLLQDLIEITTKGESADYVSFSLLATDNGGVAFFSWVGNFVKTIQFIKSLHQYKDKELPHALLRLTFEHFENSYISPRWWDCLPKLSQAKLLKRFEDTTDATKARKPACLMDDGLRALSWKIVNRKTNLPL